MPPIIKNSLKQGIPHILISMIVAPVMLSLFAWAGSEFLTNRDIKVTMPHLEEKIDEMVKNQKTNEVKQDQILQSVWMNSSEIRVMKKDIEYIKKGK